MAETLISPGVLARENDQSFISAQPTQAGAALVGPTVKGKVGIPKLVSTYSEYKSAFGSTFISGSNEYTFFTSISAYNYFNNGDIYKANFKNGKKHGKGKLLYPNGLIFDNYWNNGNIFENIKKHLFR